jgi:serine/threonine-protein kinase
MSIVQRVRDGLLLRDVAMKRLIPELGRSPSMVVGFVEEAQITGQLEHPNIVPVHELGSDANGTVFFTMKYVHGLSLHDWLRDRSRPVGSSERLADGLDILVKVCDAMSFAHSRGVLHLDLKPANVMVGEFGAVYLMDWGLARVLGSKVRTVRGPIDAKLHGSVGTPGYMSPEAVHSKPELYDERTDVFGLGAILYQIVTGQLPFRVVGKDPQTAAQETTLIPPEVALGNIGVSSRIRNVIRRALAPDPNDRYASAAAFKADVQGFVRGGLHLPRRAYGPGEVIVTEGEVGDAAYVIARGTCEAFTVVDGQRKVLRQMGPGDVFGEMAILSELPRTATVEALDVVTVLVVDRSSVEEGLGTNTWLGALVKALASRFRDLDSEIRPRDSLMPRPNATPSEPPLKK